MLTSAVTTTPDKKCGKKGKKDRFAIAEISEAQSPPATPPSAATVDVSTRRQSRHQIQLPPMEPSETQLDDSDEFDDVADWQALSSLLLLP